ncbi:hypothetical protein EMGBD1_10570 [Anaerolineaceae bacterium]|nr:hypothetical protein EMGBD1_10570 [Anaerolineaceae bacterium]
MPVLTMRLLRFPSRFALVLMVLGAALFWLPASVLAASATPTDDEVNAVASQLYCPVCENVPLDVCGTQACSQWRAIIRQKLQAGWSASRIHAFFAEQYGARVLASPPFAGASVLFWLVPLALLSAGVLVLVRVLRKPAPAAPDLAVPVSAAHAARLERELDDWR